MGLTVSEHRILVVDDSAEVRDFLANTLLKTQGLHIETAKDGKEGLAAVLRDPPDLIITDHSMPKLTGLEMIRQLREVGHQIPVILMTAEGSENLAAQAIRIGINYYFVKPFDPVEMQEAIKHLLGESIEEEPESPEHEQDLLLRLLIGMPDPVIVVDTSKKIVFCNQAAGEHMFAMAPAQVVGLAIQKATRDQNLINLFDRNFTPGVDVEMTQENGRTFSAQLTALLDKRVVVLRDITRLKEIERAKTELISTVVHDIRSPLTGILSYADLMKRVGNLNERQQMFTDQMVQSVERIKSLINDLLELDRLEAGLIRELEPVDLLETTTEIIESLNNKVEAKHQQMKVELPTVPVYVIGTPAQVRQIMANLIDNAIKYTPDGGEIRIQIAPLDEQVIISVTDTGIGIPLEEQPHVFDKFYRASQVASYEGTGLGLSIVKTIVDSYKGRIWIESKPSSGSTFTVMLPSRSTAA